MPEDSLRIPEISTVSQPVNEVVLEAAQVGWRSPAQIPCCVAEKMTLEQMLMPDAFEELFQTDLPDAQNLGNTKASLHETLEEPEVPQLPGSHEDAICMTTNPNTPTTEDPASASQACQPRPPTGTDTRRRSPLPHPT